MKTPTHKLLALLVASAGSAAGQMTLPEGTIIPESLTVTLGEPNGSNSLLINQREVSMRQEYDGKVVVMVYHASW